MTVDYRLYFLGIYANIGLLPNIYANVARKYAKTGENCYKLAILPDSVFFVQTDIATNIFNRFSIRLNQIV